MSELLCRLRCRERRGSKPRCHLLTHGADSEVAARLTGIIAPWGEVMPDRVWRPRGFECLGEAKLAETPGFLSAAHRKQVKCWWLKVPRGANTPNWDIASTCKIQGRDGLVLVEAKAHWKELSCLGKPKPKTPNGRENHERIGAAIQEANAALNGIVTGWGLSRDSHYQLSNRFAWAWKLASLGVPVILVYLGFLNADDMGGRSRPFHTADDWEEAVRAHSAGVVPERVWADGPLDIGGTPLKALIRSVQTDLPTQGSSGGM
ncbi:MAG TPA: hypothetical protein VM537_19130 [Anaerolineae bacterium]|nr:hypothetical protein [Anaerolineae bacterium]